MSRDPRILGRDLGLEYRSPFGICEDTDLKRTRRFESLMGVVDEISGRDFSELEDIAIVDGIENMEQSLKNRIMTRKGELEPLGHPEYGSRHHDLIGQPNTESNRNLVKFHLLECLSHEPRVERVVGARVRTDSGDRNLVRVEIDLMIVDIPSLINLVIPFSFAVEL
jgi:phage baseplate assembly protein W